MQPSDDSALLRQYAKDRSEEAFAALVTRHINLVHSVALRQVSDAQMAEEITQAVFIILARKALRLRHEKALSSWLFLATRLTASNFVRSEARRHRREQEAYMQTALEESGEETWRRIAPLLDTAVASLNEDDRRAIVLRFYEGRKVSEVGAALGASEEAAKKRVARALEKLRLYFSKHGVVSTATGIAGAISDNSVQAAPLALAKSATSLAMTNGAVASKTTLSIVKGGLKVMAWTKVKMAAVAGVAVLLAAGTTTVVVNKIEAQGPMYEMRARWRANGLDAPDITNFNTWPPQVWIELAKNSPWGASFVRGHDGRLMGNNTSFSWLVQHAYDKTDPWLVLPANAPEGNYDYMAISPTGSAEALQREINRKFSVTVRRELRETNVLIMKIGKGGAHGVKPSTATKPQEIGSSDALTFVDQPVSAGQEFSLRIFLERFFMTPIIDETGLTGNYDFAIQWDEQWWSKPRETHDGLRQVILDELGLELVPARRTIEMVVVEKVK
jgi:uncharacterized protein (TIGR03435 family)